MLWASASDRSPSGWDCRPKSWPTCALPVGSTIWAGGPFVVWKLDRLGCYLTHLVNTVANLFVHGVGLRVLAGQGAQLDTTAAGRLVFGIFAATAEFEGELIRERTMAGLKAAPASSRTTAGLTRR